MYSPGSERQPVGTRVGDQPAGETIEVSIILKPKSRARGLQKGQRNLVISREEFAAKTSPRCGRDRKSKTVCQRQQPERERGFARAPNGEAGRDRCRHDSGLRNQAGPLRPHEGHQYRARTGGIKLPFRPCLFQWRRCWDSTTGPRQKRTTEITAGARASAGVSYTPRQVAELYQFPLDVTGAGQTIGILEFGGGYRTADLKNYFCFPRHRPEPNGHFRVRRQSKEANRQMRTARMVKCCSISKSPGSVAPGAKIVVYFAPNSSKGFQDALTTAIHDATNKPSVISISWGGAESTWTAQSMTALRFGCTPRTLTRTLGVDHFCLLSAATSSSERRIERWRQSRGFPGLQPECSGLRRHQPAERQRCGSHQERNGLERWRPGRRARAAAGSPAISFRCTLLAGQQAQKSSPRPAAMAAVYRTFPGDADPETGYNVLVDGEKMVIGGTSAVAPALERTDCAVEPKAGQRQLHGLLQPTLYGLSGAFHDWRGHHYRIERGVGSAGPGWDRAATGFKDRLTEKVY